MFFLKGLKALCTVKLEQKLKDLWKSDSFPECIREIYASTPSDDWARRPPLRILFTKGEILLSNTSKTSFFQHLL
jgi:hypothetical protein